MAEGRLLFLDQFWALGVAGVTTLALVDDTSKEFSRRGAPTVSVTVMETSAGFRAERAFARLLALLMLEG